MPSLIIKSATYSGDVNLVASTTKPITDIFSHAVNADDENCLTATKKVLGAYGVDLPDTDNPNSLFPISPFSLPNVYYLALPGDIYYPDFMGDDPVVPTGYKKETSPTDTSKSSTQGATQIIVPTTTTPTTTSPSTAVGALTPEQMDALIEQMQALGKTIQDYHDSGTDSSITPTPTSTTPTTTSPSTPATSIYASEIPVGSTQTKYFSTANVPTGQVALSLDIKDENGNTVPVGTKVTIKDGSGNYVQADWDSTGYTVAHGAPGNWVITVNAPGYNTNTQYVLVSSSVSGTSFKTNLQRAGVNDLPAPTGLPTVTQSAAETPVPDSISSTSNKGQFTAKFVIPPGGQITGTDGAGNPVQATADSNGYVAISGSPGSWKITASATGYETLTINDYKFSGTEVYGGSGYVNLGLQKATIENQAPEQAIAYFSVQKGSVVGPVLVPGAIITIQDGSGKVIQQQVDNNGHATIAGTVGLWQYAITAPGYATQKGYLSVSSGSTTSTSNNLQPDESGRSKTETVSFDPVPTQVTETLQAAPGTLITGTDGKGNMIQATADENGYAVITAAPGDWQWTASAPGYLTSGPFNYLFTADSRMTLPQTKDPDGQPISVGLPSIDPQPDLAFGDDKQPDTQTTLPEDDELDITQPVDPQPDLAFGDDKQPDTQTTLPEDDELDITQPVDPQPDLAFGDDKQSDTQTALPEDDELDITQPVDPQPDLAFGDDKQSDTQTALPEDDDELDVTQPVDPQPDSAFGDDKQSDTQTALPEDDELDVTQPVDPQPDLAFGDDKQSDTQTALPEDDDELDVTQPVDPQTATQSSGQAFGDNNPEPVDPQTATQSSGQAFGDNNPEPVDPQTATQSSGQAFGDNNLEPVDPQSSIQSSDPAFGDNNPEPVDPQSSIQSSGQAFGDNNLQAVDPQSAIQSSGTEFGDNNPQPANLQPTAQQSNQSAQQKVPA